MKMFPSSKRMELKASKSGMPCLWECGGGVSETGFAQIICASTGAPKKAAYIPHNALAYENHALVPIVVGDYVIQVKRRRDKEMVKSYRIISIDPPQQDISITPVRYCTLEEVGITGFETAVEAAIEKSKIFFCREAIYIAKE